MKTLISPLGTLNLSRAIRRTIVFLMYGIYLGLIIYWNYLPQEMANAQLAIAQVLTLTGIIAFVVSYFVLNTATQGLADRFKRAGLGLPLDERQIALRDRAYYWGYLILGVSMYYLWNTSKDFGWGWTVIIFVGIFMSLPTAIIAWFEPDPIQDDVQAVEAVS